MSLCFDDLDQHKEEVKGWGIEFIQLYRGALRAEVSVVESDRLLIVNTKPNRVLHQ